MNIDPIIEEVRKQRTAILESYDWDFEKMTRDAMKRQWKSGHKVIKRVDKVYKQGVAPNVYHLQ